MAKAPARYWLMKSEPEAYSIDDLARDKRTRWEGVRNYQARNFMMNEMRVGDLVLFYHSNAVPPGAVGVGFIGAPAAPDKTALDPKSDYYDPKAAEDKPIWYCVEVAFDRRLERMVTLEEMRAEAALADMPLLARGQRLSVQPVTKPQFERVLAMAKRAPGAPKKARAKRSS